MKFRALHRMLAILVIGLFAVPSPAQSGDAATKTKIDEAINNHYLMMQLDKAEQDLVSAAECADCSSEVRARAWMYVGIVRGSGKSDQAGAAEAFAAAKGLDPNVQLDADLASDDTRATFASAAGAAPAELPADEPLPEASVPTASTSAVAPGALPPPAGVPGDMICSPQGAPLGLNVPVPMSCSSGANIAEAFVKFKAPGGSDWMKLDLQDMNGLWQAEIPCKFTATAGTLEFYVGAKASSGEYVDQFGSKKDPASIQIVPGGATPSYPGQAPVSVCAAGGAGVAASDCPPDFPGCSGGQEAVCGDLDWGAACKNSSQCKCGLLCEDGACATAPSCISNAECDTGSCVDGYCSAVRGEKADGAFQRHWVGLTAGMDLMIYGGEDLCSEERVNSYGIQCYDGDGSRGTVEGVDIQSGFVPGQLRLKLGYDYAFSEHLTLGARLGIAILNSHPKDDSSFFMGHIAGRLGWTFTSLARPGIRPAVYLEGGVAEVNGKVSTENTSVYKVAGYGYAALGGTFGYAFAPHTSLNLDVQASLYLPGALAFVLHPALNFTYGF